MDIIKYEKQEEKRLKKSEQSLCDTTNRVIYAWYSSPRTKREREGGKRNSLKN